ncbi:hypothetical protein A2870_01215 [Candidatus Curtissbacteria bacterium RIFCSPHIGHO2_01_FULL_41_11]|uniref:Aspartate racemase n=1 Tax=Candidatus Curtissbacteria bacterium RIFCSPHIGHO2_01_FULL_41_11 TaxID=1797711 RepID=A0A1F5G8R7_9BACT|nr:MAG: hypothetical protein A2870_01215 [Candidatus Curtissbacteria bacterium RIFCSPHIGHO2_01_FULL_41_11]
MAKNMQNKGVIAILGGMGPEASAKMLEVMVSMATREFGAKDGKDFPEIIVDSIPVPDFISNRENEAIALEMLKDRIKRFEGFDISCFTIACNTAHIMLSNLESVSTKPFVSMIDAVASETAKEGFQTMGIMATPSTLKSGLYQNALAKFKIKSVLPTKRQISEMERIIRRVISGNTKDADSKKLARIADSLKGKGAQAIILGCTELPLIFPKNIPIPVFDSIEITSRALLTKFFEGVGLDV